MSEKTILLCAGGTGGHVFPAVAMAEEMAMRGFKPHFITDARAAKFLKDTGFTFDIVDAATFGSGIMGKVKFILPLIKGFYQSYKIIKKVQPSAAIGFGGYPTVPPMVAASWARVPAITHESNAILGLANIILAPFVKYIAVTHPQTRGVKKWFEQKIIQTGTPVRKKISDLFHEPFPEMNESIKIMIVGGSLGAKIFSNAVVESVCQLPEAIKQKLIVIQQSRAEDLPRVEAAYKNAHINATVKEFYADMPDHLKNVHLLITRSGAGTITELTMAGRPAIYIPYPYNRDRQQFFNAESVARANGGWVIDEKDVTVDGLRALLSDCLNHPEVLENYGRNARSLAMPKAAETLGNLIIEIMGVTR